MLPRMASIAEFEAAYLDQDEKLLWRPQRRAARKSGGNRGAEPQRARRASILDAARGLALKTLRRLPRSLATEPSLCAEIAQTLNERGIPTARSSSWTATQVARVLLTPHPLARKSYDWKKHIDRPHRCETPNCKSWHQMLSPQPR